MKKVFQLQDLDCANCAAKMEEAIRKLDGVSAVTVSFFQQKLTIEVADEEFDTVMKQVVKTCRKIEPDCTIVL